MPRRWAAVLATIIALAASGCSGGGDANEARPGVRVRPARDVTFRVGPRGTASLGNAEEPAEFVQNNLVYYAKVIFGGGSGQDSSSCVVDGANDAFSFGIKIDDATGHPYTGPVTVRVEPILDDSQAFLTVADTCTSDVQFDRWPGGSLIGTISLGTDAPQDVDGAGEIGLKVLLDVPGTDTITIVPGEGAKSDRGDSLSANSMDQVPPRLGDHWHAAYGVFICDRYLAPLSDTTEDRLGIHTHGDGLIHIHPFTTAVTGASANLAAFARQVGLKLEDSSLELSNGKRYRNGDDCAGTAASVRVLVWESKDDPEPKEISGPFGKLTFSRDGMLIAIAFAPKSTIIDTPPSTPGLDRPSDVAG